MTTIASDKAAPAAAVEKRPARALESLRVTPDKGFAGMLGRMEMASPPTFRKPQGGPGETVSFAAMPLVAPASMDAADRADRDEASNPIPAIPTNTAPVPISSLGENTAVGQQQNSAAAIGAPANAGAGSGKDAAIRVADTRSGPMPPTQPASSSAMLPVPSRGAEKDAASNTSGRPGRGKIARAAAPAAFDLGNGITVHLSADAANVRVLVRGARIDAEGRGEVMARIVKLMRSHGYTVSEQAIEFDGGRSE